MRCIIGVALLVRRPARRGTAFRSLSVIPTHDRLTRRQSDIFQGMLGNEGAEG